MARKKSTTKRLPRIDVHSHVIPLEMLRAIEREPARYQMRFEEKDGKRRIVREGGHAFPVFPEFHDPEVKVAGMDRKGLDVSFISPAPMDLPGAIGGGGALGDGAHGGHHPAARTAGELT